MGEIKPYRHDGDRVFLDISIAGDIPAIFYNKNRGWIPRFGKSQVSSSVKLPQILPAIPSSLGIEGKFWQIH